MALCILLVDDSATTRALIRRSLSICGLDVDEILEAGNGREALALLATRQVDLILADLHMPEMSGVELAHAIFANPATASIPVAVVSAEPSVARLAELRKAGVKGFLRKPCTPESLRNLVVPLVGAAHANA